MDDIYTFKSEIRDGMVIDWDVPIEMDDGVVLRADIYRPIKEGKYPVILSYGPYGKYLHFEDGYETCWNIMCKNQPDVPAGSTNKYQNWEVVDPEKWVPDEYAVVRVDSRGCGRSPGYVDLWSLREAQDQGLCVTWASKQSWSNGKVGINGISYYAMNQYQTAALQPEGLAAICAWEGAADFYRDMSHHGGILCLFGKNWYDMQVKSVQYGVGENGYQSRMNGDWVSGPETLTSEELGSNRCDFDKDLYENDLVTTEYFQSRNPDWDKVEVPMLTSSNWGGQGLHPRGNFEAYTQAASKNKWLEVHGKEHWTEFYTDYGINIQKLFFAHFLKGENNGWDERPRVQLQVRHPGEKFVERFEQDWPLPSTNWSKFYLNYENMTLDETAPSNSQTISYDPMGDGVTLTTKPLEEEMEVTGPMAAKLFVSSESADADLFLVVRAFYPDFKEVVFKGALDPHTPIAQGWLRASHRKLDDALTRPDRPYHTHDEKQPLNPGEIYELDIEIWPSCISLPKGFRIALSVRGRDYVYPGGADDGLSNMKNKFTGVGPFLHDDPRDRPLDIFGKTVTLHNTEAQKSYVLLPVIPKK
ncbi:CocE/NonD family hydrolase [Alphaproteobacteria bacterium]|jgi:predicted acyl esterase|nr:CocE/NonD family hydrolase [Alphaproteobacteria bacterium]